MKLLVAPAGPLASSGKSPGKGRLLTKTLLAMQLTAFILLAAVFQVSASGNAQTITYTAKADSLAKVFAVIKQQTGYLFFYRIDDLKNSKPVSVKLQEADVKSSMDVILKDQPLKYEIEGNTITISAKDNKSLVAEILKDKPPVTGIVRGPDSKPISGVNIIVYGTKRGTTTNADGTFSINAMTGDVLLVSSIGYATKEIRITATSTVLEVNLNFLNEKLEEVIVHKGYYNTSSKLNTGSVGTLKAADIEKQPVSDPLMALSGRIAGLSVSQSSGVPGGKIFVNLRGRNSLSNKSDPLFIVDGIPFNDRSLSQTANAAGQSSISPFTSIRPGDIEEIVVLKDADATAIYGSRGANGVIMITTKKAKAGKSTINVDLYNGTAVAGRKLDMLNTPQYLEMRNEALKNSGDVPFADEYDVNGTWDPNRYTDWQERMVGGSANTFDGKLSVTGGSSLTQYLIGFGYRKENFVYPGNFKNTIGSGNLNINHTTENNKFNINISAYYTINNNFLPTTDLTQFIYLPPNAPEVYDAQGQLNWENNTFSNPFQYLLKTANIKTENLITNLNLTYRILNGLSLKTNLSYNSIHFKEENQTPYSSFMPFPWDDAASLRAKTLGLNQTSSYILEPQLNYTFARNGHYLDALIGSTFNESNGEAFIAESWGYSSDASISNSGSATNTTNSNSSSQYRYNALYFRAGYNYNGKYVLNVTARRDGSSRFGPGKQFGNFGAIGAAWLFYKERWMKTFAPFLSMGKLRGSFGRTGSDGFPDYEYLSTYRSALIYFGQASLEPTRLTNPDYRWESINKAEVALETGFLDDKIQLSLAYYLNRTNNQLVNYNLPRTTGFSGIRANFPATVENKGFEFEINTFNIDELNFKWKSSLNLSIPKNRLVSYPNISSSSYANSLVVGMPTNIVYLYHYTGLDKTTGIYTFEDFSGNGIIDFGIGDMKPHIVGQRFFGGLNNTFTYKGISLDIFFQYVNKRAFRFRNVGIPGFFYYDYPLSNQPTYVLDRWQKGGDDASYQLFIARGGDAGQQQELYQNSDALITDASFTRLKNVMLSYDLPKKLLDRFKINRLRIYAQGQNLLTITKYQGLDPENSSGSGSSVPSLPPLRIITAGLQLTL
jgi:TonB-dependent starch-binding outer membrane protein SusC